MSQLKITAKHESVRINSKTSQCIGKLLKDMEEKFAPTKAYIVYWDSQKRVIKQAAMYAETLLPIPLTRAVKIFKPEFAAGANVTFENVTGELSEIVVFKFLAMKRITNYCSRVWVNPEDSAATGSIVCYDGYMDDERISFMEIASCHSKARLHQYKDSTPEEFLNKLKLVREELDKFINHLETRDGG